MCLLRQKYCGVIVEGLTMENTFHITFHFIDESKLVPCFLRELAGALCYDSIKLNHTVMKYIICILSFVNLFMSVCLIISVGF